MLKRKIAYICVIWVCICLCACSNGGGEIILIGSESEAVAMQTVGLPEKNRRKPAMESVGQTENVGGEEVQASVMIRVHVCGAVMQPGVVELKAGSRVEDALASCGGFAQGADRAYVNLAAWAEDGEMIYFPTVGEVQAGQVWQQEQRMLKDTGMDTEDGAFVNINTANVTLLCTLPGIGESRAKDIIAYREANGPFRSCDAIMSVPGIKSGIYEEICNRITVD